MAKEIPKGCQFWPKKENLILPTADIIKMYDQGFAGSYLDREGAEKFNQSIESSGGYVFGEDAAMASGFAESGQGLLLMPFINALILYPGCWPGAGQARGDCVSHSEKNANMTTYCSEVLDGSADEVSGKVEIAPKISMAGIMSGAFSTEVYYWFRGSDQDGWYCQASSEVASQFAGLVTRDNHPSIGFDLTKYSGDNAGAYGRKRPGQELIDALDDNLIRQATNVQTREGRRDFLANGYGLHTCGSEGFANKRNKHGVSNRKGTWAHAMCVGAFDDRESTHEIYGDSLELYYQSWSVWNSGPRDIRDSAKYVPAVCRLVEQAHGLSGTLATRWLADHDIVNDKTGNIQIPKGFFWVKSRDVAKRSVIAKSSVNGWPKRAIKLSIAGAV